MPILSVVLEFFSYAPHGHWVLGFFSLSPLFLFFIKENSLWRLLLGTFLFRFLTGVFVTFFVFEPMVFILSSLFFTGLALMVYAIKFLFAKYKVNVIYLFFLLPFLFTFWDFTSARFSFFPHFVVMAGNVLGSSPFVGLAHFGGIIGLTFFSASVNLAFALFLYSAWKRYLSLKKTIIASLTVVLILSGALLLSLIQINKQKMEYEQKQNVLQISAVSVSENFGKVLNDISKNVLADTMLPIKEELLKEPSDFVILPQRMIDAEFSDENVMAKEKFGIENQGALFETYSSLARDLRRPVMTTFINAQKDGLHNSNILISGEGEIIALKNKFRLMFFSEYWPFGSWHPFYYNWFLRAAPEIGKDNAVFNPKYQFTPGIRKNLTLGNLVFATPICLEAHYPYDLKALKDSGAEAIFYTTNNQWLGTGVRYSAYAGLTYNLLKIESVWLDVPIIINGRYEKAGIITPDGKADLVDFQSPGKNYGIWTGVMRY